MENKPILQSQDDKIEKNDGKISLFTPKICIIQKFDVPLHSISKTN